MKDFVFSPEALKVGPSPFRVLADKLAVNPNVINFTIGQPDFDVPEEIKKEFCAAVYAQKHGYGATAGVKALREKILAAKNFGKEDLDVQITTGVQGGFFTAFRTFVSTGEEVLIPDPYYLEYKGATDLLGLNVKFINTYPLFKLTLEMVKQAVTEKTKVLMMNAPNNPTGLMYDKEEMAKIIRYLDEKGVMVFYDTIYQEFNYTADKVPFNPFDYGNNVIVFDGFSKAYGMPGWRLGYMIADKRIIERTTYVQSQIHSSASTIVQYAACAFDKVDLSPIIERYHNRRDLVEKELSGVYDFVPCEGGFYFFLKVPETLQMTGTQFCDYAFNKGAALLPGGAFSSFHDTHVRFSFTVNEEKLAKGLEILKAIARGK
jgi:aspartate/methionine/tyrosine aminotransferase